MEQPEPPQTSQHFQVLLELVESSLFQPADMQLWGILLREIVPVLISLTIPIKQMQSKKLNAQRSSS